MKEKDQQDEMRRLKSNMIFPYPSNRKHRRGERFSSRRPLARCLLLGPLIYGGWFGI
jgi:hypothetical protein